MCCKNSLESLDLALSDLSLSLAVKDHLSGHCFTCKEDVKCVTVMWPTQQGLTFYTSMMDKHITRCDKCLNHKGDYVEKWGTNEPLLRSGFCLN